MKKQRNQAKIVFTIIGLMVLYIVFFPVSLTREAIMEPVWFKELTSVDSAIPQEDSQDPVVPFRAGNLFGYVDLKGHLRYRGEVLYDVTQTDKAFINYPRLPENLVMQNTQGDIMASLPADGYPLFSSAGDKLFLITNDSMCIRQWEPSGQELWNAEFASLITCLAVSEENVLVGLVNGKLKLFDNKGSLVYDAKMAASQMPVILGCAVSEDAMELAGVSGLHPQKFFFVQRENFNTPQLFSIDLDTDFRRELLVKFSKNGKYCFFEQDDGLGVFNVKTKMIRYFKPGNGFALAKSSTPDGAVIPGPARVTDFEEIGHTGHLCLLMEKQKQTKVLLMQPVNLLYYNETIPYQNIFMNAKDNHLFLGFASTEIENTGLDNDGGQPVTRTHTYLLQCDFYLM